MTKKLAVKKHRSKLTENQVIAMREAHKNGTTMRALATLYNISEGIVRKIIRREMWKHIP